jgi:phenylacetic acid degradation operon negative regulatory protein
MSNRSPQDLVFTLFGEFLLHRPEPVWVGSLIELLEPLGVGSGTLRTALSRMQSRDWLEAERAGRRSFYRLTDRGRRLLEEGEARIYRPHRDERWDGEWTLVAYSIPEDRRTVRDKLRTRLSWLGFGSLGNGLWITPHEVELRVKEIARELEVTSAVEVFRSRHLGNSTAEQLVTQCWDLPALNARYEAFIGRHLGPCRSLREGGAGGMSPVDAYVRRFELVHEYREFPLLDPYLPRPLHTADWAGECSHALFQSYQDELRELSDRFVESQVVRLEGARGTMRV